jgi:hypothetical protein
VLACWVWRKAGLFKGKNHPRVNKEEADKAAAKEEERRRRRRRGKREFLDN